MTSISTQMPAGDTLAPAMLEREQICRGVAEKVRQSAGTLKKVHAVIGMDGFVDLIIDVVDRRESFSSYSRIKTIGELGQKIVAAAGKSANYELVVKQRKLGGNGPIYAYALALAGLSVDYIGSVGYPTPDEVFAEFGRHARLHPICEPGFTDALEFTDGKLMLGKITQLAGVNWQHLVERVGLEPFTAMLEQADLIAMNNWTMLPLMGEIWQHVLSDVLPKLTRRPRRIFIDLADPEKRSVADLQSALKQLTCMQQFAQVTLGVNLKEAAQVTQVLGLKAPADDPMIIQQAASAIRDAMAIQCVVIHPRGGAGGADADGQTAWFTGPLVKQPKLSTGAGDNFNAGFCLGQLAGCSLAEALACGCATSGYYVRHAGSPGASELADFAENMPAPEV